MKHKIIRVDNLMYKGCEPHWGCTNCGYIVPFHCFPKEYLEQQECKKEDVEKWKTNKTWSIKKQLN